ncbi:helix-turn-helix domain-containing protein [Micrococcus terreus]|uniref:helix-turn-helix transcriptional regulator n=1 Tax=Micrococcus terreus TaxID=574650 RepID=UPI0033DA651A
MDAPLTLQMLGRSLRAARREAGLTQVQLAELVGLSDRTVRDLEKGAGGVSLAAALRTAEALGLHIEVRR